MPLAHVWHRTGRSSFEGRARARPPQDDGAMYVPAETNMLKIAASSQASPVILRCPRAARASKEIGQGGATRLEGAAAPLGRCRASRDPPLSAAPRWW